MPLFSIFFMLWKIFLWKSKLEYYHHTDTTMTEDVFNLKYTLCFLVKGIAIQSSASTPYLDLVKSAMSCENLHSLIQCLDVNVEPLYHHVLWDLQGLPLQNHNAMLMWCKDISVFIIAFIQRLDVDVEPLYHHVQWLPLQNCNAMFTVT